MLAIPEPLNALINALRHELQEYGEMLARLDQQQESIVRRAAVDVMASVGAVQEQATVLQEARQHRQETQRGLAAFLQQPGDADLGLLADEMPVDYRPLVRALVDENNELLFRIQQRARQNHLLLHRSLELMQALLQSLIPTTPVPVYDGGGNCHQGQVAAAALYEAVG